MIFIFTTTVCCYRYDPNLMACTQFVKDPRLYPSRWTRSERRHYSIARQKFEDYRNKCSEVPLNYEWWEKVFDDIRAEEPDKTLVELRQGGVASYVVDKRIKEGYYERRGDRLLCLSFFHNDEDTKALLWGCPEEELLEDKASWIAAFTCYPHVKMIEIPYDFTLTEEYLRGLFEQYVLNK